MPNIWTHILFCEDMLDSLQPTPFNKEEALLNLGAQGPDPFFYHNFWPWRKNDSVNQIGSLLHTENCGNFLMDLIIAAEKSNNRSKAYVFGFVTHHLLDRNTHPYIHYRAGYEGNKHQKLEVMIDTLMMQKYRNFNTWKVPVYKEIDAGRELDNEICSLLYKQIDKYFPAAVSRVSDNFIQASYRQMKLALSILFDPNGWKNKLLRSHVSSFSHQPIKDQIDYLNEKRTTWYHPATNEPSNMSFIQLYEQARLEGIEIMTEVIKFWKNPNPTQESKLRDLIGNLSYDTGKALHDNYSLRYCDPIV